MGYLGPFSGRLGTAVGYMWNGKCCLRSYQRFVRNPRTEAQQAHRSLFKQQVQLAARMKMAINETLTDLAREAGMTAYNLFVKGNQHAFYPVQGAETVLGVDYSSLRLSMGDALGVVPEGTTLDEDNVLTVSFARGTGRAFDRVYLYVYVPDLGEGFLSTPVYRREKRISLALPDDYAGHELHAWLMVKGETGGWSESVYVDVSSCLQVNETTSLLRPASLMREQDYRSTRLRDSESCRPSRRHTTGLVGRADGTPQDFSDH